MSLASDIIKRAFGPVEPPAPKRTAETKPVKQPKPLATLAGNKRGFYRTCAQRKFYGVEPNKKRGNYRARIKAVNGSINLGEFTTPERAAVAVQLYLLWFRRGFIDIPTGKWLPCSE